MGKKIDFTMAELNQAVDKAEDTITRKRRQLFKAENDLIDAYRDRARYCSPLELGEEVTVDSDGAVANAATAETLGEIKATSHFSSCKLKVEEIESLESPPYYCIKVRKLTTRGKWSKGLYEMPYLRGAR